MPRLIAAVLVLSPLITGLTQAQTTADSNRGAKHSVFAPLPLPSPTVFRTASGRPGRGYWQQRADYRIKATLDTATGKIRGRETIHYTNNSPDPLRYLWMFVEQNICSRAGITEKLDQPPLVFLGSTFDFSCKGFDGGLTLDRVSIATLAPPAGRSASGCWPTSSAISGCP